MDVFESESGIAERLRAMSVPVAVRPLPVGDYIVGDRWIERKTIRDLDGAIPASVRGVLLSVAALGVDVVRSADPNDTALWIAVMVRRDTQSAARRRPQYAQKPRSRGGVSEAMLAAVPDISVHGAVALLQVFGTVKAVANANDSELLSVPGIGPKRAAALARAFTRDARLASRSRSERMGPSP
jgi:ERCC4-type nuclease